MRGQIFGFLPPTCSPALSFALAPCWLSWALGVNQQMERLTLPFKCMNNFKR